MMDRGAAKAGGMPLYKRLGNRILTRFENRVLGTELTEFHSGYRAYDTHVLAQLPFEANSDGFDFDTQIIAQLVRHGGRIVEVPIPTYYGDEICYVNGLQLRPRRGPRRAAVQAGQQGFRHPRLGDAPEDGVRLQGGRRFLARGDARTCWPRCRRRGSWTSAAPAGCSPNGPGPPATTSPGWTTWRFPGCASGPTGSSWPTWNSGLPAGVGSRFDVVVAGDIIEHLSRPGELLRQLRQVLRPGGQVLLSVPNFGHWYPRVRVATGTFGYDRRGILDNTHLRFFTRSTLRRTVRAAGFDILDEVSTGLPLGAIADPNPSRALRWIRRLDGALVRARPTLFGYQHILRLTPHAERAIHAVQNPSEAQQTGEEIPA